MPRRTLEQVQADEVAHDAWEAKLNKLRNSWLFANVYQYIYIFGDAVKIDTDIDIDVFEEECLKPEPSQKLAEIGLAMLKWVSSHRGLTLEIFEEYTRRQYNAKAPDLNPFGDDEEPTKFRDLDLYTKLKVLHQLSVWTLWNPDRMREKVAESDQTSWRCSPFGYDAQDRAYYLLDDNRLYRMTYPDLLKSSAKKQNKKPKPKPKKRSSAIASRSSKRQKLANGAASDQDDGDDQEDPPDEPVDLDNGIGGAKWECLAVTLDDYLAFMDKIKKSKNPDERDIYLSLQEDVIPTLEKAAEAKKRKDVQRMKELENLQRLATAKRSSRIAGKQERQREVDEQQAAEEKRQRDLEMAYAEQERQHQLDITRESRMQTREQRLKDREVRRILHEEELARLERGESMDGDGTRISERNRKLQLEQKHRDIEALKQERAEEDWYFDCSVCGATGKNFEDNRDSIACEKCGVWQHSGCHGIAPDEAIKDDFHFICHHCKNYPNGIKISVKRDQPPDAKPKANGTADAAGQPQKKKPGRPRKQPDQTPANGNSLGVPSHPMPNGQPAHNFFPLSSAAASAPTIVPQARPTHAFHQAHNANPAPPLQQPHGTSLGPFQQQPNSANPFAQHTLPPGTSNGTWPASLIRDPRNPLLPLTGNPPPHLTEADLGDGHASLQRMAHNSLRPVLLDPAPPLSSSSSSAAGAAAAGSQTPDAKPAAALLSSPSKKTEVTQHPAPFQTPSSHGQQAAFFSQVTPGHTNPTAAPSSAASTRFLPSPHARSNSAVSGKSPTKQEMRTPSSSFASGSSSFRQGELGLGQKEAAGAGVLSTPAKAQAASLAAAPVLSPSVNTGPQDRSPPVKKPTPEKRAAEIAAPPPPVQYPPPPPPPPERAQGGTNGAAQPGMGEVRMTDAGGPGA